MSRRRAVYRLYDSAGALLYVGVSVNPDRRVIAHAAKPWGADIAPELTTFAWYDSVGEAALAEMTAIVRECPRHNISGAHDVTAMPGRNRGGRPPIGPQINVAFPPDLLARIDERAAALGVSRSEWIRTAVLAAL